ncbi:MAG: hypothetical protein JXA24_06240 [Proteobacteria bacterium]|nr:hypothetical protein [Pseudomonadota bacterium]
MGKRIKRVEPQPIEYTTYTFNPRYNGQVTDGFDPECLEETSAGPVDEELIDHIEQCFPGSVGDSDGDSYREMDRYAVEIAAQELGIRNPLPLAPLFLDDPNDGPGPEMMKQLVDMEYGEKASALSYLPGTPPVQMSIAIKDLDFEKARLAFQASAASSDDPLKKFEKMLGFFLDSVGVHAEKESRSLIGLPDEASLDQPSGFSVDARGRLRIDCKIFAEIAHRVLKGIPGLKFHHIVLINEDRPCRLDRGRNSTMTLGGKSEGPTGHMLLWVADDKGGSLIIDNDSVRHMESTEVRTLIKMTYGREFTRALRREIGDQGRWQVIFSREPRRDCTEVYTIPNFF